MAPHRGEYALFHSSQHLPPLSLGPLKDPRTPDPIELTQRPSRALDLAMYIASGTLETQGHAQVGCARHRGPRTDTIENH